jgi:murein endopeptidase
LGGCGRAFARRAAAAGSDRECQNEGERDPQPSMSRRSFVRVLLCAALCALALAVPAAAVGAFAEGARSPSFGAPPQKPLFAEAIAWRPSRAHGIPWSGRLVGGVRLPSEGIHFFTWDPVLKRSPNRPWRRWGSDRLARVVLRVLSDFAAAHPSAPRIGVGDLSRPRGGDFGRRFGGLGHVSHQNGLDVDVYYPRRDARERPPGRPRQTDVRLAQELVDRFVAAGAVKVFVGPGTPLQGPPRVVQKLAHHDNHFHVRLGYGVGLSASPSR